MTDRPQKSIKPGVPYRKISFIKILPTDG